MQDICILQHISITVFRIAKMTCKTLYVSSLMTAVIEQVFFTGLIFGWPSLTHVLKNEGYMRHLCTSNEDLIDSTTQLVNSTTQSVNSTTQTPFTSFTNQTHFSKCKHQDESLNLVFTIASVAMSLSTLPNGYIFDKFGTWTARMIASLLVTTGAILTSISNVETSLFLFPAMCCFSVGGILLLVTNIQIGNLFGRARSSVITLLNGGLDSSSVVFLLVKLAYDNGISLGAIFQFIAWCTILLWVRTFFLMPRKHIPFPLPKEGFDYGIKDCKFKQVSVDQTELKLQTEESSTYVKDETKVVTFKSCLRTPLFWTNVAHLSLLQLRNYFFLSTFNNWMKSLIPNPDDLSLYIVIFGTCQFFGLFTAPFNGLLVDSVMKWRKKYCKNPTVVSRQAVALSALTTSILGIIFSVLVVIPSASLQYLSFVLQVIFRSFLYGGNSTFIALLYPSEHFGKLYGLTMTLGGVVALLQFPLFRLVLHTFHGDFLIVNVIFLIVCVVTSVHSVCLYLSSKKANKKQGTGEAEDFLQQNDEDEM